MNKWFKNLVAQKKSVPTPRTQPDTFYPPDIEEERDPISLYREGILTTEYNVTFVQGRKIYQCGDKKLITWTKEQCEKRVQNLLDSKGDHKKFWADAVAWASNQPDKMHAAWADDCNALLEAVYDRLVPEPPSKAALDLLGGSIDLLGEIA